MYFQSPLHRGSLFNSVTCSMDLAYLSAFSPLFIGEVSSMLRDATQRILFGTFSPLFIGEVSSMARTGRSPFSTFTLSVPSSSGKSLQFGDFWRKAQEDTHFQSPLHRGSLFNAPSR